MNNTDGRRRHGHGTGGVEVLGQERDGVVFVWTRAYWALEMRTDWTFWLVGWLGCELDGLVLLLSGNLGDDRRWDTYLMMMVFWVLPRGASMDWCWPT
jgi:hypothetical protein